MEPIGSVGDRVADARKTRGLSQRALAERAHISYSLLTKIEQGDRDATPGVVATLAKALGVDVSDLTGQPYHQVGRHRDRVHEQIPALRRALMYWDVSPTRTGASRSLDELRAEAAKAATMRRTAQHCDLRQLFRRCWRRPPRPLTRLGSHRRTTSTLSW